MVSKEDLNNLKDDVDKCKTFAMVEMSKIYEDIILGEISNFDRDTLINELRKQADLFDIFCSCSNKPKKQLRIDWMISYKEFIELMEKRGYTFNKDNPITINESDPNIKIFPIKNGEIGKILEFQCPENTIISAYGKNHTNVRTNNDPNNNNDYISKYSVSIKCLNEDDKEPFQEFHQCIPLTPNQHTVADIIVTKILQKDVDRNDPNVQQLLVVTDSILKTVGSYNSCEYPMWSGNYKTFDKEFLNYSFNLYTNEKMIFYAVKPDTDITKVKFEMRVDILQIKKPDELLILDKDKITDMTCSDYAQHDQTIYDKSKPQIYNSTQNMQHIQQLSGNIQVLTPSCPGGAKQKGNNIALNAAPMGGTAPYTVTYYKKIGTNAPTSIGSQPNVPEATSPTVPTTTTINYVITNDDVRYSTGDPAPNPAQLPYVSTILDSGKLRIITQITDSCPTGAQSCLEFCDITLSCTLPACNLVMSQAKIYPIKPLTKIKIVTLTMTDAQLLNVKEILTLEPPQYIIENVKIQGLNGGIRKKFTSLSKSPVTYTKIYDPTMFRWKFGDEEDPTTYIETTEREIYHTYQKPGTYLVKHQACNFCTCSDWNICFQSIEVAPPAVTPLFMLGGIFGLLFFIRKKEPGTYKTKEECERHSYRWTEEQKRCTKK